MLLPKDAVSGIGCDEFLWSRTLRSYTEQAFACVSGRIANNMLNMMLHRNSDIDSIKLRTMTDMVEREGSKIIGDMREYGNRILKEHGWNPKTGLPEENAFIEPGTLAKDGNSFANRRSEEDERKHREEIDALAESINQGLRQKGLKIPDNQVLKYDIETDSSGGAVIVSLDGVGAKRQKDSRPPKDDREPFFQQDELDGPEDLKRAPDPKKRPKVETAVAHIEADGQKYMLAATNMFVLCEIVLAFLLEHGLLNGRKLLFLTDGGRDIKGAVETIFAFCPYTLMLDWFHLKKHCLELLSMCIIGGKKNFSIQYEIKRNLFRRLFAGDVDGAKQYLDSLPDGHVKNKNILQSLSDYLERRRDSIACYILRREMGLRISSNPVEKANDMLVSRRQKGKGMSWSRNGSWGLAGITAKYLNNESRNWNENHSMSFEMYPRYGSLFCANDDVAELPKAA